MVFVTDLQIVTDSSIATYVLHRHFLKSAFKNAQP